MATTNRAVRIKKHLQVGRQGYHTFHLRAAKDERDDRGRKVGRTEEVTPTGLEHLSQGGGKAPLSQTGGAESGAIPPDFEQMDPDLQTVIDAWPTLPSALKAGILAMIAAARTGR
jgi:hypothetical protein